MRRYHRFRRKRLDVAENGRQALVGFVAGAPGRVVAVDSGDNASHEPFQSSERKAYQGRCFAILKAVAPRGRIDVVRYALLQGWLRDV